jgi:hypothetical protein
VSKSSPLKRIAWFKIQVGRGKRELVEDSEEYEREFKVEDGRLIQMNRSTFLGKF